LPNKLPEVPEFPKSEPLLFSPPKRLVVLPSPNLKGEADVLPNSDVVVVPLKG
jgi:hypothetical protein